MACHFVKTKGEPGSKKISLKWKSSVWIKLFWYLRYLFVLYANEKYTKLYSNKLKCIKFTNDKTKDKSISFVIFYHKGFVSNVHVYKLVQGDFLRAKLRCEYNPLKIACHHHNRNNSAITV